MLSPHAGQCPDSPIAFSRSTAEGSEASLSLICANSDGARTAERTDRVVLGKVIVHLKRIGEPAGRRVAIPTDTRVLLTRAGRPANTEPCRGPPAPRHDAIEPDGSTLPCQGSRLLKPRALKNAGAATTGRWGCDSPFDPIPAAYGGDLDVSGQRRVARFGRHRNGPTGDAAQGS